MNPPEIQNTTQTSMKTPTTKNIMTMYRRSEEKRQNPALNSA
jgi:hypothetical protein